MAGRLDALQVEIDRYPSPVHRTAILTLLLATLAACAVNSDDKAQPQPPRLAPAHGATLASCSDLATRFSFANTFVTAAQPVAAGVLTVAGTPVPAHCQLVGRMNPRTSPVDGQAYAIGFEMRLPVAWNGRFFYQANGGLDGAVVTATGGVDGGPASTHALAMGFAVISSDAGHDSAQNPSFGIDPQARLDYGYQAAAALTPMAKAVIHLAYGRGPDRSYFGGCSNGGRHAMVAATRQPDEYDGYLVGDPGFRLPLAAVANIAAVQGYATVASTPGDPSSGFTLAERHTVSAAVLGRCDSLDGATDGLIQDTRACKAAFDLSRDVPTCAGARDGTCLTAAQKAVIGRRFAGETTGTGRVFYSTWPFDTGMAGGNTAFWYFTSPLTRDSGAVGLLWQVPPENPAHFDGPAFARAASVDSMLARVQATSPTYTESALSFMLPPNVSDLARLGNRGAKMMIYHGTSDPIFSSDDTTAWYESLRAANGGSASQFARFFLVPGMTHCSGGPATDEFDMLTPLVNWVEQGVAPDSVVATARGPGHPAGTNPDVPATWAVDRSRPLCPYPKVARYKGTGSLELADSFSCR